MKMDSSNRGRARTATIATFAIQLLCMFLYILSYAGPWWYAEEIGDLKSSGLWMICRWGQERLYWDCMSIKDYHDPSNKAFEDKKYAVCQAFMTLGLLCYIASMVLYIISFRNGRFTSRIAAGVATAAGAMALITCGIYASIYNYEERFYGWSFILSTIVGIVAILTGIAGILTGGDASKGPKSNKETPLQQPELQQWDAPSVRRQNSQPLELSRHFPPKQSRGRQASRQETEVESLSFDDRPI